MGKASYMMVNHHKREIAMAKTSPDEEWAEHAKGVLKAELKRRNMTYRDLAERLTAAGSPENERNLNNKIARGSFTAAFLIQCLRMVGCESVDLSHLPKAVE